MRSPVSALIAATAVLGAIGPAMAGDFARPEAIGFSADGRYFAYEAYGTGDASEAPYAQVHVADLDTGQAVPDTGAEVVLEIDQGNGGAKQPTEDDARAQALKQARPVLAKLKIEAHPTASVIDSGGRAYDGAVPTMAHDGIAAQGKTLTIEGFADAQNLELPVTVQVVTRPAADTPCNDRPDVESFALTRILPSIGTGTPYESGPATVYTDNVSSASRNCPLTFGLYALYGYKPAQGKPRLVAMVAYFPRTWEEPDRRFLAIPVPLP